MEPGVLAGQQHKIQEQKASKFCGKNSKQQVSYKMAVDFSWKLQRKAFTVLRKTTQILELSTQTRRPAGTQNGHPPCLLSESHRAGLRGGPRGKGQVLRTRPTLATGRDTHGSRGQNKWRRRDSTKPLPTQRMAGKWALSAGSWCVWDSEHSAERRCRAVCGGCGARPAPRLWGESRCHHARDEHSAFRQKCAKSD